MDQPDFKRACTASICPACWLCRELPSWNRLLNRYGLNLTETLPGQLALTAFQHCHCLECELLENEGSYSAAFFVRWLPQKHRCLRSVKLISRWPTWRHELLDGAEQLPNADHVLAIRELVVSNREFLNEAHHILRKTPNTLEVLELDYVEMSPEVIEFFRTAPQQLKKLSVLEILEPKMLTGILSCPRLTELSLTVPPTEDPLRFLVTLLKNCRLLEKVVLVFLEVSRTSCKDLNHAFQISTVRDLIIYAHGKEICKAMCEAVAHSLSLKAFTLRGYLPDAFDNNAPIVVGLLENSSLQSLALSGFPSHPQGTRTVADALAKNKVLRCLGIDDPMIDVRTVLRLASALDENKTVKLKLANIEDTEKRQQLLCGINPYYGRIEISPWTEDVATNLAGTLSMPEFCPEHLTLDVSKRLSEECLSSLRESMRKTRHIRTLTLLVNQTIGPLLGDVLGSMLENNKSITTLELYFGSPELRGSSSTSSPCPGNTHIKAGLLHSGDSGRGWKSEVLGKIGRTAKDKVPTNWEYECNCQGLYSIALCVEQSSTVISFGTSFDFIPDFVDFVISRSITRNLTLLNDAVRFVTRSAFGRHYAQAFETLAQAPSLNEQLQKVTFRSEQQCQGAIRSAAAFLQDNFFTATNVVQRCLECHSLQGTQLDDLDVYCLRAIVRYLSVSDVLPA